MASSPNTLNSIHVFSIKPASNSSSSSSSCLSSMKLKTLLQTFIFSHIYRVARALTKAKSVLIQLLKNTHLIHNKHNKKKKLYFGSFRLHYNWCSSRTVPAMMESYSNYSHVYCNYSNSSWSSAVPASFDEMQDSVELSKYLQWLEEKGDQDSSNEIDRLADLFIANCHEKFRLEKQESYRRFQEMMDRSV